MSNYSNSIRKKVRKVLLESHQPGYVIVNKDPELNNEPPKMYYDTVSGDFIQDLFQITPVKEKEQAIQLIMKLEQQYPEYDLGIYTEDVAQVYFSAFKSIYNAER